ncbi:MAG: hypothetical protein EXS31_08640 [Pedosphaera sp.]|nr:hypothetical protein [Pedosphaera sp.]
MTKLELCFVAFGFMASGAQSLVGAERAPVETILHQPSWLISNQEVSIAVTQLGGHMAPVTFFRNTSRPVQPYHISPWQNEKPVAMPVPVLVPLRGDFFCLPFGGNTEESAGEKHSPHGETAGSRWKLMGTTKAGDVTTLRLAIDTQIRKGRVTKELSIVEGQNAIYLKHTIEGFAGRTPLGHHATLTMPEQEGRVRIATSAIRFGMTCPSLFSDPKQREYQSLLPGTRWTDLSKVPAAWKNSPDADLTRLPARLGHADLVQIVNDPSSTTQGLAWTTATYADAGYVWFSLKDPAVLNSTVFWMENHGRHGHPWNGRNNCLGLEDVTAHFADGLKASTSENALTKEGVATAVDLSAARPTVVNYIQGVVKIPEGFECVKSLKFAPGSVTFISTTGKQVTALVRHEFLKSGKL